MATHTIEIRNFDYHPKSIVVKVGDGVKWINRDASGHTATRVDLPSFDTGPLSKDQESAEVTFSQASGDGGYAYICTPHPFMTGTVVVES